ncbi:MAG: asparagine synthase C-terminal domain-containing protein, partial [Thermoleophilia bacterium]|nr:asparagine synthase C-terminal domain-containing protein [Thermoleophilia bacterium]
ERQWARAVAEQHELVQHEVEIGVDQLAAQFDRILWHLDEPIAGPGVFPQLLVCDLAADWNIKAVLGGQGGDELFGGYLRHRALHYKQQARTGSLGERLSAAAELFTLARGEWKRVRRTSTRVTDEQLDPTFLAQVDPSLREEVRRGALGHASARDLMWHDLRAYLPALLHVEDRVSMAASIESRTPLLDYRLVELMLTAPTELLFARGEGKPLLRAAVRDWLPESVVARRDKKGFPTPLHQWRDRPALRALVMELTSTTTVRAVADGEVAAVFNAEYLAGVEGFEASELWTVMTVNGWLAKLDHGAYAQPRRAEDLAA